QPSTTKPASEQPNQSSAACPARIAIPSSPASAQSGASITTSMPASSSSSHQSGGGAARSSAGIRVTFGPRACGKTRGIGIIGADDSGNQRMADYVIGAEIGKAYA